MKQEWRSCDRTTTFNVYVSIDWWAYELVKTTTDFEYEIFLSKIWEDIRVKTEITQTWTEDSRTYEHLRTEIYIDPMYKY